MQLQKLFDISLLTVWDKHNQTAQHSGKRSHQGNPLVLWEQSPSACSHWCSRLCSFCADVLMHRREVTVNCCHLPRLTSIKHYGMLFDQLVHLSRNWRLSFLCKVPLSSTQTTLLLQDRTRRTEASLLLNCLVFLILWSKEAPVFQDPNWICGKSTQTQSKRHPSLKEVVSVRLRSVEWRTVKVWAQHNISCNA